MDNLHRILITVPENSRNPYITELYSSGLDEFNIEFGAEKFWDRTDFDLIHIHWPEELFRYKEISNSDYDRLKERLAQFKKNKCKIIFTRHNEKSHYYRRIDIYKLIQEFCDINIHLGQYSLRNLPLIDGRNVVIPHHVYKSYSVLPKITQRKELGFNLNKRIAVFPGSIRNVREYNLVKKIISTNSDTFFVVTSAPLIGLKRLIKKPWVNLQYIVHEWRIRRLDNAQVYRGFMDKGIYEKILSASDIAIIPRVGKELNSGLVFLAKAFGLKVIGPEHGNISEHLNDLNGISSSFENCYIGDFDDKKDCNKIPECYTVDYARRQHATLFRDILSTL